MKARIAVIALLLAVMLALTGCPATGEDIPVIPDEVLDGSREINTTASPVDEKDPGALLTFSYGYGSYNGGQYDFNITRLEDDLGDKHIYFKAEGSNGVDMYAVGEVEQSVLDDIAGIIAEYGIFSWNGFSGSDDSVLDGYGFGLAAEFENGVLRANGYMKEPDGYAQGHAALAQYLEAFAAGLEAPEATDAADIDSLWVSFDEAFTVSVYAQSEGRPSAVSYIHGEFRENLSGEDIGEQNVSAYIDYIIGLYNAFKDAPRNLGGSPGGYISMSDTHCDISYEAAIDKEHNPDVYDECLTRSLAIVGKTPDFLQSQQYDTETYQSGFIYPAFYFYDKDGLGAVVIDMPAQTVTAGGEVYTASRQAMTDLYAQMSGSIYQDFPFVQPGDEIQGGYLEDSQTAQSVFEGLIEEGYVWILGRNHIRDAMYLYGGKAGYPDGWKYVADLVQDIINNAEKG